MTPRFLLEYNEKNLQNVFIFTLVTSFSFIGFPLEIEGSEKIIHATGIFQQYNCILGMGKGGLNNPSISTGVLETV